MVTGCGSVGGLLQLCWVLLIHVVLRWIRHREVVLLVDVVVGHQEVSIVVVAAVVPMVSAAG